MLVNNLAKLAGNRSKRENGSTGGGHYHEANDKMRLGGRLAAAIEVLEDMAARKRPVADALKDWGLNHRFAGSGDRAAIGNIVYDALRRRRSAGWLLGADTPREQAFGGLILEGGMSAPEIDEAMRGDKFAPPPLSADEHDAIKRGLEAAPPQIRADIPDWCQPLFEQVFPDDWAEQAARLSERPPLDMRVNTLLSDRDTVLRKLEEFGTQAMELAPEGLRIAPISGDGRHPNVQVEPTFQQGWFEIQDEGSQIAPVLAGAAPGMNALDYCAGGGGKTLALAAQMKNEGKIYAHDSEKPRLAPIFDRLRRADVKNVEVMARASELAPLAGQMDLVLIDAPCTGSGTWRRRPDAKWRLSEKQLELRYREQSAILDEASRFVKPGGRLVYITCSVFDAENRDQVSAFLKRNPAFQPVDHEALWQNNFVGQQHRALVSKHLGVRLTPLTSGTDGFYFAAMERQG